LRVFTERIIWQDKPNNFIEEIQFGKFCLNRWEAEDQSAVFLETLANIMCTFPNIKLIKISELPGVNLLESILEFLSSQTSPIQIEIECLLITSGFTLEKIADFFVHLKTT
jgi:hypothetical protein